MTYTIEAVKGKRDWEGSYGPMVSYDLALKGVDEKVELAQKPSSPAPLVGQELQGSLEAGKFGLKFKKDKSAFSSNGGGQREFKADPAKQRAIIRQSAQKAALEYAALQHSRGKLPDEFKVGDLGPIVDWFFHDAVAAMEDVPVAPPRTDHW